MRIAHFALAFLAALHLVAITTPAFAAPPSGGVQPVPYNPSQPVPVGQPASPRPTPAAAPAPTPVVVGNTGGTDTVYLKGGGMIRGHLVEVIPNDHATIALPTGQTAIVEWSRIDRIEQQQAPPNVVVQNAPAPATPKGSAWVHIETDREIVLEGSPPEGGWAVVCNAPCDRDLPLDYSYRVTGPGIRRSKVFQIGAQAGQRVVISINPGSTGGFVGGIVLASIGIPVIFVGLIVVLVGALENATCDTVTGTCTGNSGSSTETTGWIITLVGVGSIVTGIILIAGNARTSQTQEIVLPGAQPVHKDDAWLRVPTWHEPSNLETGLPRAQTLPIFSHSF